jgi:predicted lipoprotein with Yx(FWY)xxD motif
MPRTTAHARSRRAPLARLLAAMVAGGLLLAACGDDDDTSTAGTADAAGDGTTRSDAYGGDGDDDESGAASGGATVDVASDDALGEFLVGPDGRTLYLFAEDQGTTTACTGACADNWPPLVADDPRGGDGVDADELSTADGIEPHQVTYHGHLLYYFAGDDAPGDTNGTAVPSWFAVDPGGEAIEVG